MLIKYKTEPTIIVLSPNSANLIKILTQFVYSINIRHFSPPPPLCFATQRMIFPQTLVFRQWKRGGVKKTERLKNSNSNKIKSQPLPLPCHAAI